MPTLIALGFSELVEVVWVAAVAGIGVTAIFSVVVYAAARSGEARRAGRRPVSIVFLALAVLGSIVLTGLVGMGLRIMAS